MRGILLPRNLLKRSGLRYGAVNLTRIVPYHSGGMLVAKVPVPPQPRLDTIVPPLVKLVE